MLTLLFCFGTGQEREEAEKLFKAGGMAQKVVKAKLTDEEQAKIKVNAAPPKCSSRTFLINSEILHYGDRKYANIFTTEFEGFSRHFEFDWSTFVESRTQRLNFFLRVAGRDCERQDD